MSQQCHNKAIYFIITIVMKINNKYPCYLQSPQSLQSPKILILVNSRSTTTALCLVVDT